GPHPPPRAVRRRGRFRGRGPPSGGRSTPARRGATTRRARGAVPRPAGGGQGVVPNPPAGTGRGERPAARKIRRLDGGQEGPRRDLGPYLLPAAGRLTGFGGRPMSVMFEVYYKPPADAGREAALTRLVAE